LTEEKCRYILEQFTGKRFYKKRLPGTCFILDGFCKQLKLAFEYNGEQHYKAVPHFQQTLSLKERQQYDKRKQDICNQLQIQLIIIPYWIAKKGDKHLISYIDDHLKGIPKVTTTVSMRTLYNSRSELQELKTISENRGGRCLSTEYIDSTKPMRWECRKGHIWTTTSSHIKRGSWCKRCSRLKTIDDMQQLAAAHDGKCLSTVYTNAISPLEWECRLGHRWAATPNQTQQGRWCSTCKSSTNIPAISSL
jgi:hypothetical protein